MAEQGSFADFLRRIRAGDQQAATELVRRYESAIRREIRLRMTDPALTRLVDSVDICQSVLAGFFVGAAVGRYDLEQPGQLLALLIEMARNKLISMARKQRAQRRDVKRLAKEGVEEIDPVGAEPTPSRVVEGRELLQEVRKRLTPEECQIADLRGQGCSWTEVVAKLGGTPDGRRHQLSRAMDRVGQQLGIG